MLFNQKGVINMARKTKFSQEQILEKTKEFIKKNGIEKMNARDLCKYIGCSTQPIFKNFESMEGLKTSLKKYLHDYYDEFINEIVKKDNYLFTISYAYAMFSYNESYIFKALFMSDLAGTRTIEEVIKSPQNIDTIKSIQSKYKLTKKQSEKLYIDVRFYTHGLSCQIACNNIQVSEKEIKKLINNIIKNLRKVI